MLAAVKSISQEWYVDPNRRDEFIEALARDGILQKFVSEIYRHKTREKIWISENAHAVYAPDGSIDYFEGTVENITEQVLAAQAIERSERQLRILTHGFGILHIITDEQGIINFATDGAHQIVGQSPEALIGRNVRSLIEESAGGVVSQLLRDARSSQDLADCFIVPLQHTNGFERRAAVSVADFAHDPSIGGMVWTIRDETETIRASDEAEYLANFDSLTNLYNRRAFEREVSQWFASAQANHKGKHKGAHFLLLDLHRFKQINDMFGFAAGDHVLKTISERLLNACGDHAIVGRLGGDEFAALIPEVVCATAAPVTKISVIVEHIMSTVASVIRYGEFRLDVGAVIGFARFPEDATTFSELVQRADLALIEGKKRGVTCWCPYTPGYLEAHRTRSALARDLAHALETHALEVRYQPQVSLADGQWNGVEALVRWFHPERGHIDPGQFIAVAEERQLISRIGAYVMVSAMRVIAALNVARAQPLRLAVNVSVIELRDAGFVERLRTHLEETSFPPALLDLEITESTFIDIAEQMTHTLLAIRALGVRLVLDDFCVANSSMSYLKRVPVDGVKIDRSFVAELPDGAADAAIVRSIMLVAEALHLRVVAEGIETAVQRQFLLDAGCADAQGFLFSRAISAAELQNRLYPAQKTA